MSKKNSELERIHLELVDLEASIDAIHTSVVSTLSDIFDEIHANISSLRSDVESLIDEE